MQNLKFIATSAFIVVLSVASGCTVSPVVGAINVAKWDGNVANPNVSSLKNAEACAHSILGIAYGDASIETARKAAGITKVAIVDHRTLNILYFYGEYCTVIYGE